MVTSYELKQKSRIDEIGVDTLILEHKKTKAKVFLMPCDDENKVFAIGFRTPVDDSTGVPHILEHSVLCGSEKYPCKDPFIELAKGSLNTFLNAMTYPDKTVYPVASCNDKDFENLMGVYLDAVFKPNIHREEKIFRQEGWHYELDSPEGELTYNGVVYNEMKGVYSSADGILERAIGKVLYENHTYGEESGGDPANIPELTYEAFKDFHKRYYHPSNSYIFLYGNCDMDAMLEKIDAEYLSQYDRLEIDSTIPLPKKWNESKEATFDYPISDSEEESKTGILSYDVAVDCELDALEATAMQILDYLLLEVPGAPLQEALVDAGIGDDVSGGFSGGIRLPYFSVTARNTSIDKKDEFVKIVTSVLKEQADGALDKQALKAAINVLEFRSREADYGSMPKGLIYGLQSFDSWLYDADPTIYLRFEGIFKELKARVDGDYFEGLIKKWLIDNEYKAVITLNPVKGLTQKNEDALKAKLADIKSKLSSEEIDSIIKSTKELKEYQSEPSKKEDILKIPMLKREDIRRKVSEIKWEIREENGYKILYDDVFTSGIAYLKLIFNMKKVKAEDIPYVSLLSEIIGYIDSENYSYSEMSTETNMNSGGIGVSVDSYPNMQKNNESTLIFSVNAKVLYDKTDFAFEMMNEMLFKSKLTDVKRLKDIVAEVKSRTKEILLSSGHQTALNRAGSTNSIDRWFSDQTRGIAYYRMLENCNIEKLSEKLIDICHKLFTKDNLLIHVVCDEDGYKAVKKSLFVDCYKEEHPDVFKFEENENKKEAYTSASMVNYVARSGNFKKLGYEYDGALSVLRVLMNYDYLWNNIRVLGGAYGCSAVFGNNGACGFATYRDPNLSKSDETFLNVPEYIRNYQGDERDITKAVIGAISEKDTPLTPLGKGLRGLSVYYGKITDEYRQRCRDEILDIDIDKIHSLAPMIEAVLKDSSVCALANESKSKEETKYFDNIESLY